MAVHGTIQVLLTLSDLIHYVSQVVVLIHRRRRLSCLGLRRMLGRSGGGSVVGWLLGAIMNQDRAGIHFVDEGNGRGLRVEHVHLDEQVLQSVLGRILVEHAAPVAQVCEVEHVIGLDVIEDLDHRLVDLLIEERCGRVQWEG